MQGQPDVILYKTDEGRFGMIIVNDTCFYLETKHTSYVCNVMKTGQIEHLYYGNKLFAEGMAEEEKKACLQEMCSALSEKRAFAPGNTIACSKEASEVCLEELNQEVSFFGQGDIREPFVELQFSDGSTTLDFRYQGNRVEDSKSELVTLPCAYVENGRGEELVLLLKDTRENITLELHYAVFEDTDVITRSAKLINESRESIKIKRLMSLQLDLDPSSYVFTTFHGSWISEMNQSDCKVVPGVLVNRSNAGVTSSRANNFVMLSKTDTTEDAGDCMGFHLVYSGNHYEAVEMSQSGRIRLVTGINPTQFGYCLSPNEFFESPEAVMTFSSKGKSGMSHNLHSFIKEHIVRGNWKKKKRPVLINSWEAAYFQFDEGKLLKLAKAAKEVGIELFVMDDGWFGKRDSDQCSLGDWSVNEKKLPHGVKGLCDKINEMGMDFGIWIEPEMVNEDSDLYRTHPDWAVAVPNRNQALGRNQMFLDLTRKEVREYVINAMSEIFSSSNIRYVKWDMNRIFSDGYSLSLTPQTQDEFYHRYICGFYEVAKTLTQQFPDILFEACASGGNRFDLGILCYFPQIWASDNTDPICRATMQYGYSYGYPQSVISAHVSASPNHQTLRETPIATRFGVAAFAQLGYECNLTECKKEELEAIKHQIEIYKEYQECFQYGDFYRLCDGRDREGNPGGIFSFMCVDQAKEHAVLLRLKTQTIPGQPGGVVKAKGLLPEKRYYFHNQPQKLNIKQFGDLVNTASPIRIKNGSLMQEVVSKFVKLDGEEENVTLPGSVLMQGGIHLKQEFQGTGFNENVRIQNDFGARLYFLDLLSEE